MGIGKIRVFGSSPLIGIGKIRVFGASPSMKVGKIRVKWSSPYKGDWKNTHKMVITFYGVYPRRGQATTKQGKHLTLF
ncbi:MAG: hypothetical protein WCH34_17000, partial [Bacteroidota bacterium]